MDTGNKIEILDNGDDEFLRRHIGPSMADQQEMLNELGFQNIEQLRMGSFGTIKLSTECYSFYQGLFAFIQKMALLYSLVTFSPFSMSVPSDSV